MVLRRLFRHSHRRQRVPALAALVVGAATVVALAVPAQATPNAASASAQAAAHEQALAQTTQVGGQQIQIVKYQTASSWSAPGGSVTCR